MRLISKITKYIWKKRLENYMGEENLQEKIESEINRATRDVYEKEKRKYGRVIEKYDKWCQENLSKVEYIKKQIFERYPKKVS